MKRQGNDYEVIIWGSGLGGLLAGTLLAKTNRSVLLLKEKRYQSFLAKKGYWFTPFSNFSGKNLRTSLLHKISQALDLPLWTDHPEGDGQAEKDEKQKVSFQVILPKSRIDLYQHHSLFQREFKREFPAEISRIENLYYELKNEQNILRELKVKGGEQGFFPLQEPSFIGRLNPFNLLQKEKIRERLYSFSKEFKQFIQLQLLTHGNLVGDQVPFSLAAYLLLKDEWEGFHSTVNLETLEENILELFYKFGGRVEEIDQVEKVEKSWREGVALTLGGGEGIFQSKYFIFNLPLHQVFNFLSHQRRQWVNWGKRIRPRYISVPLFLGIREKGVPVGMKDLLVSILDLERPFEEGNLVFLALSPKGDETKAPEGRRALTLQSLMPVEKWNQTSMEEYQKGVINHLYHLFPFIENHIEFVDFQWATEQIPCWSYSHFLYGTTSHFHWRTGVIPTKWSVNLYFIGKENFPYLGVEGEIYSGLMVAKQILKRYS